MDESGANDQHPGPGSYERVTETLGKGVETRFRRPVDEVGASGPFAGDRREHDQGAVALGPQPGGHHQARRHGRDVVDPHRIGRRFGIGIELGLIAQNTEGEDDQIDVAVGVEGGAELVGVRSGVEGVEGYDLDRGAEGLEFGARGRNRAGVAHGEDDGLDAPLDQLPNRGEGDLGGSAQYQDGLWRTEGILHERQLRFLERSATVTETGSR